MVIREGELPHFLKAQSPMGLRLSMLRNNTKHGYTFHYFDIQFVNGSWFAWFYLPAIKTIVEDSTNEKEK